ncbi:MAG TPA: alpha/beta fold hydrolase [Chloroflexia bacterium]|nr:alpha/beta fold hydrolase [Chloroflexia bacterium]
MTDASVGAAVRTSDVWMPSFDGTELACRVWEPAGGVAPGSPVAVLHHGVAYYGAAYDGLGAFLAELGVPLCALDARGHGRSGGQRGALRNGRTVLFDLHTVACWVRRRYPGHPLLLIGESMGGLFALNYAALFGRGSDAVAGLVLVAPGLLLHPRQVADFTIVRRTPQARRDADAQGAAMRAWQAALRGSRDLDWRRTYDEDPLVLGEVSGRYMMTVAAMSTRCPVAARRWTRPTLILHGKRDGVVPYQGSIVLYHLLAAEDKELILFPEVWHTMFSDPDTPAVLGRLQQWLQPRFLV